MLDDLGIQIETAAARMRHSARPPRRRRSTRRSLRLVLVAAVSLPMLAAVALAATQLIHVGAKVPRYRAPGRHQPLNHASASQILPLRAADPDGGPAWGIRTFRVPHRLTCVQVARVLDARIGVLGRDGAFGDDGAFHEIPAQGALALTCGHLDGAGRLFLDGFAGPTAASADGGYLTGARAGHTPVPPADRRTVVWGFAGPKATQVAVTAPAIARRTLRPRAADDWAYLFVLRGRRPKVRVVTTYAGGRTCISESATGRTDPACIPPPGYVAP